MKLLLDTHIFLWVISNDQRLTSRWREAISNPRNDVFLSVVSVWECVIKHALGKLPLPAPAAEYIPAQRVQHQITSLELSESSVARLGLLAAHHRDPFDRMLICQAQEYGLQLLSSDPVFHKYPVSLLMR